MSNWELMEWSCPGTRGLFTSTWGDVTHRGYRHRTHYKSWKDLRAHGYPGLKLCLVNFAPGDATHPVCRMARTLRAVPRKYGTTVKLFCVPWCSANLLKDNQNWCLLKPMVNFEFDCQSEVKTSATGRAEWMSRIHEFIQSSQYYNAVGHNHHFHFAGMENAEFK